MIANFGESCHFTWDILELQDSRLHQPKSARKRSIKNRPVCQPIAERKVPDGSSASVLQFTAPGFTMYMKGGGYEKG
jgi:hypothetical protein